MAVVDGLRGFPQAVAAARNGLFGSNFRISFFDGRARTGRRSTFTSSKRAPIVVTPPHMVGTSSDTAGRRDQAEITRAHVPGTRDLVVGTRSHVEVKRADVVGTLPHLARNEVTIDNFRNSAHAAVLAGAAAGSLLLVTWKLAHQRHHGSKTGPEKRSHVRDQSQK